MLDHAGLSLPDFIRKELFKSESDTKDRRPPSISRLEYLHLVSRLQNVGHAIAELSEKTTGNIQTGTISDDVGQSILNKLEVIWQQLKAS